MAPADAVAALAAAGETTRLRILALLAHGELAVGELASALGQSQPRISRHLKLLTESGLVVRLPEGAWVFYRLAEQGTAVRLLVDVALRLIDRADPEIVRDQERLEAIAAARAAAAASYFAENAEDWGRVSALHLPEADIEAALRDAAGPGPFEFMVDVGVGQGRTILALADRVRRAEGFDTSRQMLALARTALGALPPGRAHVRLGDVYDPPIPPQSADLVTVHQVLHFLPDPRRAVMEAARLLKPGGRMVIVDFAPHGLEFLREQHAHRRLGFADEEIHEWCAAGGVPTIEVRKLDDGAADKLTVAIWSGNRALAREI
jgi:DNA-binding transcriptional ArsR family regulator/SAM-dependent methyltransferase